MTRYYFNLQGDHATALDLVGRDLESVEAAKTEAVRVAGEFDTAEEISGLLAYDWIEVLDDSHRPVARLPLAHTMDEPSRRG